MSVSFTVSHRVKKTENHQKNTHEKPEIIYKNLENYPRKNISNANLEHPNNANIN